MRVHGASEVIESLDGEIWTASRHGEEAMKQYSMKNSSE